MTEMTFVTLRSMFRSTYNEAYAEAVKTAPEITGEELVACHTIARKIAAETVHAEKEARQQRYLKAGYTWCVTGCGALCSPGWAYCPFCEPEF